MPGRAVQADPSVSVAVFGDNAIADYLTAETFVVDVVSMEELETTGFLSAFDVFIYTRDGDSFGTSLTETAAANVQSYVGTSGRGVLLNGDFADAIDPSFVVTPDPEVQQLISNSVIWAAASGNGYVGEFTGAVAGLAANSDDLAPLAFIEGSAGPLQLGDAVGSIAPTPAGLSSPVMDGVDLSSDPEQLAFGSIVTGVDASHVLAVYDNPESANDGNPAVMSFTTADEVVVCEPESDCTIEGSADGGETNTTITASGAGVLKANFESGGIDCRFPIERPFRGRDYREISGFTTEFFFEGNGDIIVVGQVSRERMREIGLRSLFLHSCFAGPRPFRELNLTSAQLIGDEYLGLLPNCGLVGSNEPCVRSRRPLRGIIVTRIPFGYHLGEDPKKRF